jgi:hypothetical protein
MWFSTGRPLVAFLAFAGVALMLRLVRDQMARGSPSLLRSEIASDRWFLPSLVLEDPEVELALAGTPAGT